jgi:prepilin-type processing-associated H-X9-DG protein
MNNVKQLSLGLITYAQDYDEHFPGWVTNPGGRLAHNTWDEQINSQIKSKDVFRMAQGGPGIRSYSDPRHERVVSYGLNALLITSPKRVFDGRADFSHAPARPMSLREIADPARVILFAETATRDAMPAPFGDQPDPVPFTFGAATGAGMDWQRARDGWIDISPRDWVENTEPPACYDPKHWNNRSGIARDQYKSSGGPYAFVDGHVRWMLPEATVSDGAVPPDQYWTGANKHNQWNPRAAKLPARHRAGIPDGARKMRS